MQESKFPDTVLSPLLFITFRIICCIISHLILLMMTIISIMNILILIMMMIISILILIMTTIMGIAGRQMSIAA